MALNLNSELHERIGHAVRKLWPEFAEVVFDVSEPDLEAHGDRATNVAMVLAKLLKQAPIAVAEKIKEAFHDDRFRIDIQKPGFINFFFTDDFLASTLKKPKALLASGKKKKEKIVIEHTNVNPNKAMHIGHLRNAVLGDVVQRVLGRAGFETEVQYYVDDTGVQVADTFLGLHELQIKQGPDERFDQFCWRVYAAINHEYEKNPKLLEKRTLILAELEKPDSSTAHAVNEMARKILHDHLQTMAAFAIDYDLLVWESDILAFKFWDTAFGILKGSPRFVKANSGKNQGCWVLKSDTESGDDEHSSDKVIIKSDGTITYTAKDIAYHLWKFNLLGADFLYSQWPKAPQKKKLATTDRAGKKSKSFGRADYVYNVIDVRQAYPQAMVKLALESLRYKKHADRVRHVAYGIVSLSRKAAESLGYDVDDDKGSYSMSGRKGLGVQVDMLRNQIIAKVRTQKYAVESTRGAHSISPESVAVGALKYFMLRYNPQSDIAFDFDEALSLEGNTGPYIQYAHARAAGILEKARVTTVAVPDTISLSLEERRLLVKINSWQEIVDAVAEDLHVNRITEYAFSLANLFNAFYEACPVLKAEGALREQRLALVNAYKQILADVLSVLGMEAPEKM